MIRTITLVGSMLIAFAFGLPAIPAALLIILAYIGGVVTGNEIRKETSL